MMSGSEAELGAEADLEGSLRQVVLDDLSMKHLMSLTGENVPVLIGGERHFATVTNDDGIISCVVRNAGGYVVLSFCCNGAGKLLTVDLPKDPVHVALCLASLVPEETARRVVSIRSLDECEMVILRGLCDDGRERGRFLFDGRIYTVSTIRGGAYLACTIINEDCSFVISFACNLETGALNFTHGGQHCMFVYDFLAGCEKCLEG